MRDTKLNAFAEDKGIIISEALKIFGGEIKIIIYGGYGRNEGGWILDQNNQYQPYNDYDIIILKESISFDDSNLAKRLKDQLLNRISISFIDISLMKFSSLSSLKPSVFNKDLVLASSVIYGDLDLSLIEEKISNLEVPLIEAEHLFFTRSWIFSGGISVFQKDEAFKLTQIAKAIFAITDAILIMNRCYVSTYSDKVEMISKVSDPCDEEFIRLNHWALKQRLDPMVHNDPELNIEKLIDYLRKKYTEVFLEALSELYKKEFNLVTDFISFYRFHPSVILKRIMYPIFRRKSYNTIYFSRIAFMYNIAFQLGEIEESIAIKKLNKVAKHFELDTESLDSLCYGIAWKL